MVLSSEKNLVENLEVSEPLGTSDHSTIRRTLVAENGVEVQNEQEHFNFKGDYEEARRLAKEIDWTDIIGGEDISKDWNRLKAELETIRNKCVPKQKRKQGKANG